MELQQLAWSTFVSGKKVDPHQFLGLHEKGRLIRIWRPKATELSILVKGEKRAAKQIHSQGIFSLELENPIHFFDYLVPYPKGIFAHDPYAFLPTFTRLDEELFSKGKHWSIYRSLGSHPIEHQGIKGVKFAVWAPCAIRVVLMCDLNDWSQVSLPMRPMGSSGVWELFVPKMALGECYLFGIETIEGEFLEKADPYAFQGEMRPGKRSVVATVDEFSWNDHQWLHKRKKQKWENTPINIYELHLGSWKRKPQKKGKRKEWREFCNYEELAHELALYCKKMGYTHVEILPIMGHPLDQSWGYQVSGYYAISRRYGTIQDFQFFVDYLHRNDIGVIFDWVPAHFSTDDHALAHFDGTCLYEHMDPRRGFHPKWTTHIFNYDRHEVSNFLIGSALFYLREMHVDGLRFDAVSSMLYLDFAHKKGEWLPNALGGNENLEAIAFLRELITQVQLEFPDVLLIAEESHAFPKVTKKVSEGGLGFHLKWSLGWAHDTLSYFQKPLDNRWEGMEVLVREIDYFFEEAHLIPLSHDEVVHQKKSLLAKMPGNEWQKFANLRLLLSYMICHPGKKLAFMGGEIGQLEEWSSDEELPWELLSLPYHQKLHRCLQDLYALYRSFPPLFEKDFDRSGFVWVARGEKVPILAYLRLGKIETALCVHNFSAHSLSSTFVLPHYTQIEEKFTTDSLKYGGYGILSRNVLADRGIITLDLPPLTTRIFALQ